eukprot:jgi/Chrzof1/12291/Cz06g29030.t1
MLLRLYGLQMVQCVPPFHSAKHPQGCPIQVCYPVHQLRGHTSLQADVQHISLQGRDTTYPQNHGCACLNKETHLFLETQASVTWSGSGRARCHSSKAALIFSPVLLCNGCFYMDIGGAGTLKGQEQNQDGSQSTGGWRRDGSTGFLLV